MITIDIDYSILKNYTNIDHTVTQGKEGYGKRDPTCSLTEQESKMLDLAKISEETLVNKQIKLMIGFGALMGFRGSDEHTSMMWHQIGTVFFYADHPKWPNVEW